MLEFWISGFTDSNKTQLSSDLLMALVHMAQVNPLACNVALLNCARAATIDNTNPIKKIIFFMIYYFRK
jgi:hypothetical protein